MRKMLVAALWLLGALPPAQAAIGRDRLLCKAAVLQSEELTFSPIYHHTVRAQLLIIPPAGPPLQTTLEQTIPWQVAPLRQGQTFRFRCDAARLQDLHFPN